jgi:anthranilate synthase component 1
MKKIQIRTECKKLLADVFTPVGIYLRLRDRFRDTILLESTDHHAAANSWSFIGVNAIAGIELVSEETVEWKLPGQPAERFAIGSKMSVTSLLHDFILKRWGIAAKPLSRKVCMGIHPMTPSLFSNQFHFRQKKNMMRTVSASLRCVTGYINISLPSTIIKMSYIFWKMP